MKAIYETSQFRKDFKKIKKQGKQIEKLKEIVRCLAEGKPLEARHRDHALIGPLKGSRDCHVEPDWLLIYRIDDEALYLERTGSHSDIFKN
ncbi:MAG: type II toxin-antitoxin system YafQ family toxin [Candidatus Methylacidiphilales bacterium]